MATLRHHAFRALAYLHWAILGVASVASAEPTQEQLLQLNTRVLRVQAALSNGAYGLGSGVVIGKNLVVTSCHVVANAQTINLVSNGENFAVTAIQPDWKHDVCVLKTTGLNLTPVNIAASKALQYEQSVFTIGYPGLTMRPLSTYGVVKGLYPMDDGLVIRTTSSIRVGASGGGLFDDEGNLVGVITVKSPGPTAYYYNVATEWIQAALKLPEQSVFGNSELPFWAQAPEKWPHFMQVVHPYLTENWGALQKIAANWAAQEPETAEAWFYLASAEYANKNTQLAKIHFQKVIAMNHQHTQAIYHLGMIANENGQREEVLTKVALLNKLDKSTAAQLQLVSAKMQ